MESLTTSKAMRQFVNSKFKAANVLQARDGFEPWTYERCDFVGMDRDSFRQLEGSEGAFPYIGLPYGDFCGYMPHIIASVKAAYGYAAFLDIGSGAGDKVALALTAGADVAMGLEFDPAMHSVAKHAFGDIDGAHYILGSVFDDSVAGPVIHASNIIYLYCPMSDRLKMRDLHRVILNHAAPGTTVVEFLFGYCSLLHNDGMLTASPKDVHSIRNGPIALTVNVDGVYDLDVELRDQLNDIDYWSLNDEPEQEETEYE